MKNKKLLLGVGVLALVLAAGFLASGRSLQGATRNARNTPAAPVTLTFAASPNPVVGGEIVAGAQAMASNGDGGVLVARYQVTASAPASNQVTITDLNFENDYDDQNPLANNGAISQVSLHFPTSYSSPSNLNGVAFATLNLDGQAQFSGLNFKLRGGVPTQFEVQVTTNPIDLDIPAGDQIEMDLSPKYIAVNNRTGATIDGEILPDGIDGPEFTLVGPAMVEEEEPVAPVPLGTLTISRNVQSIYNADSNITVNSNPSAYSLNAAGNNQYYVGQYKASNSGGNSGERFQINTLTVSIENGEAAIQNLYIRYPSYSSTGVYLSGQPQEQPATSINNGEATFNNLNMWSQSGQNAQNWFNIKAVLNPLGQGSNAGDLVEVDFQFDGTFHAVGQTSGAILSQPNGNAADVDGPNKTIVAAAPAAPPPPPPPSPYGTGNSAAAAPTVNLLINGSNGPVNINSGDSIALSWTTTNATACIAEAYPFGSGTWSGSRATSGEETLNQITTSRNYMLTCWSGSAPSENTTTTDPVMVNVAN